MTRRIDRYARALPALAMAAASAVLTAQTPTPRPAPTSGLGASNAAPADAPAVRKTAQSDAPATDTPAQAAPTDAPSVTKTAQSDTPATKTPAQTAPVDTITVTPVPLAAAAPSPRPAPVLAAPGELPQITAPPVAVPGTEPAPAAPDARTVPVVPATQPIGSTTTQPATLPSDVIHTTPQTGPGREAAGAPPKPIQLELKDAPLSVVLDFLSEHLGFTIKKNGPIEGKISLISRRPVTADVALMMLDEALAEKDLTAVQDPKDPSILKIVSINDVKKYDLPIHQGSKPEEIAATAQWITQIIPVKNIDAVKLRQDLQPMISANADFTANQGSNSLIMTDTSANIKRIVTIIAALDETTTHTSEVKIYHLKFANSTTTAKLITTIFAPDAQAGGGGGGGRGGPGGMIRQMMMGGGGGGGGGAAAGADSGKTMGKVTATADDRTNSVVVVAPADTISLVTKIIEDLDSDPVAKSSIETIQLKFANPASAAKLINTVFQPDQQQGGGGGGGNRGGFPFGPPRIQSVPDTDQTGKVTAAAADNSNTIVVTAPPAMMKVVREILEKLDADPAAMSQVNVFTLKYAASDSAASLINSIFAGTSTPSTTTPTNGSRGGGGGGAGGFRGGQNSGGAGSPQIQGAGAGGARVVVNAVSDSRTNTVVVTAPSDAMLVVGRILETLDANPSAESSLFIYHLRNGVAADIQQTLSALFSTGTTGSTTNNNTGNRTSGQSLTSSGLGSTSGFGGASGGRSGGLGGSSGGLGGSSSSFGQPLTGNTANRLTGASGNSSQAGANVRATSELVGEVIVVADNDTNSLLVSTASKYREQVVKIIQELDRPVPQVLIKVLVAEVTHDRTNDFGTDFSVLDTRASGKGLTASQTLGNLAAQSTSGGLVVSLAETNLNGVLHALSVEGKLDVLSRPYILASDNQPASITIGQEVPFITNTQITDTGQQINTITYQAVGIILNVTPHINPDGAVTLDVSPEISAISATTVPIGNGISAPVIDNRSAQSRVTIRNGNTIVIGGMMQDQKTSTVTKIPLLGDIPLIGSIFARTQTDVSKTELLIFLTPHVAAQPELLGDMSKEEIGGTVLTPIAVRPGEFQRQMAGMKLGATTQQATTHPSITDFQPPPSTQPLQSIKISGESPTTNPAQGSTGPGK